MLFSRERISYQKSTEVREIREGGSILLLPLGFIVKNYESGKIAIHDTRPNGSAFGGPGMVAIYNNPYNLVINARLS